jgi:hypothetical protein
MPSQEWGIFNDESADYTTDEAVEAQFYSREEAEAALAERYADADCHVQPVADPDDEEDDDLDDEAEREDEEDSDDGEAYRPYPIKY